MGNANGIVRFAQGYGGNSLSSRTRALRVRDLLSTRMEEKSRFLTVQKTNGARSDTRFALSARWSAKQFSRVTIAATAKAKASLSHSKVISWTCVLRLLLSCRLCAARERRVLPRLLLSFRLAFRRVSRLWRASFLFLSSWALP